MNVKRPEYVNNSSSHSLDTWLEACLLSQDWAERARSTASKRHKRNRIVFTVLGLLVTAILLTELFVGLHFKGWL